MLQRPTDSLKITPLYDLHVELGGKMEPFAGHTMPMWFNGVITEHLYTRTAAGLFDVSHMGQARIYGVNVARILENLTPGDILGLKVGCQRYTQFTNDSGGILDDLMVTNLGDHFYVVVNASRKEQDFALMRAAGLNVEILEDHALLALQGPRAAKVLSHLAPEIQTMKFMSSVKTTLDKIPCYISRSGYSGEDGYEISLSSTSAISLAQRLLKKDVWPIGLAARDSLRLEAGFCLYGHDIDETTTPVEANLLWSIGKRRREEGGFPGDKVIQRQIAKGVTRRRVGIKPTGKVPARAHTEITDMTGQTIGKVTSGGFSPSINKPIAMGYVKKDWATVETPVNLIIRSKPVSGQVSKLPFIERYNNCKQEVIYG